MSLRAVNSMRYNATYDESAFTTREEAFTTREESFDPREDSGNYSVPHPEDEYAYRNAEYIDGIDDEFQEDYLEYDDDYVSRSGSDVEDWGFEFAQDEVPYGEPPQGQVFGRTVLAPTASNASTAASAPPRGPTPINYPPLPTTAPRDYASFVASSFPRDQLDTRAAANVGEIDVNVDKTGGKKRGNSKGKDPIQDDLKLDIGRALEDSLADARPRPPPLTDVNEPREKNKKRTSVGSFLRSARGSQGSKKSKNSRSSDPPSPRSPRGDEKRGKKRSPTNSSGKGSPTSQNSVGLQTPDRQSDRSSPRTSNSSSPRNSQGRRSPGKGKRSSKDGRNSRQSRQRDRRPARERVVSCVCEWPAWYVRNVPARCPCICVFCSFLIVAAIISLGFIMKTPTVDTDLDSLMKTVVNSSVTHDAFVAAVGAIRETYGGRRLQGSIAAYVHSDIYLAYELAENSPYKSVADFEALLKIFKFEQGLRQLGMWKDECARTDIDFRRYCEPGISMVNFMLPTLQMNSGSVLPDSLELNGEGQDPLPMPASLFLIEQYDIQGVVLPKDFDPKNPEVPAFRSAFFFKVPVGTSLDSASVLSESVRKVRDRWKAFIQDAVFQYLEKAEEQLSGIRVYYTGTSIQGLEVMSTLMEDLKYAIGSFVFVLVYLVFHTQSPLSSVFGLIIIVSSVPLALVTFLLIASSNSVNIASFLSMFLVVGLGADVVFVYTDFWNDSRYISKDVSYRAIWTYKHAGKASLATTVTTALSFFANIASVLRSLRDFGMFMGLCVVYVWVVVSLIYVPVLILNERCSGSCGVHHAVAFLSRCCGNRSRMFNRWVRRMNQCRIFLCVSSVVLGLTALISALAQVKSDMATPNIFPGDHNQHRGVTVMNMFAPPASLKYVAQVDVPPPPMEVNVCSDSAFADMLPCSLFWCEAVPGVSQQENEQCTCYYKLLETCENSGFAKSTTRFVGLGSHVPSQEVVSLADQHLKNQTSAFRMYNAIVKTGRPPMVIERWETGDAIINGVRDVQYDTMPSDSTNKCGWDALCFCGQSICRRESSWSEGDDLHLPARRLQTESSESFAQRHPLLPRRLTRVPPGARASVDVAFGLLVDPSIPLFGEKAPEDQWRFLDSYKPEHPRAQRDMYTLCSKVGPELLVIKSKCWIMDFRVWLLKRGQRFPIPADIFQAYIIQFAKSSTTGGGFSKEFLWRENTILKASYVQFEVDISSKAPSQEALDYKTQWDNYLRYWNSKASPFTRGAFHVSKLWVQAQAQQELMSSTVTTLAVLAVLSLMSMLAFTKDLVLSVLVVASTVWVVTGLLFFIVVICKWPVGAIEAIALIVFIGYALTYSLHIAHVYCDKEAVPEHSQDAQNSSLNNVRLQRTNFAVRSIGGAILGSALTTAGCTVFLLLCTLTIFLKLGAVVLVVTFLSVISSFLVMPSALLLFGPANPGQTASSRCLLTLMERLMSAQRYLRRRSSEFIAARTSGRRSSNVVSAASFVEGVMEDEPAAPPPSSHRPSLPGVGGITSAANRLASAAAVVAPQRKVATAMAATPQRAPPSKPMPENRAVPASPLQTSPDFVGSLDDRIDLPSQQAVQL